MDVGAIIKMGQCGEQFRCPHLEPWLRGRGLGSGPSSAVWLWPSGHTSTPFWPRVPISEASEQRFSNSPWPVRASFSPAELMSPHLASLKIQLCDVNGISLQKKEMRLASVLPGKESEVGPTFGSPMCPTSPPPWAC